MKKEKNGTELKIFAVKAEYGCELRNLSRINENKFENKDVSVRLNEANGEKVISLEASKAKVKRIKIFWKNTLNSDARILGDALERSYGDLEWRGIVPERVMPWYFVAVSDKDLNCFGVKTGASALCFWMVNHEFISLTLDTRCGGEGVELKKRKIELAKLVIERLSDESSTFEKLCKFVKMLVGTKVVLPEKPVYGFNDWYYAYGINTAERILEDSKLCSELADDVSNRPFSVIDAGWQYAGMTGGSPWGIGNRFFPDMRKLAEDIKKVGCRPGIWFRPLLTNERFNFAHALYFKRFPRHSASKEVILDPSIPENLETIRNDVKTFIDWGYELIKHDFTTFDILGRWGFEISAELTDDGWVFYDKTRTTAEIIKKLYETIFLATEGKALIIGCNTIGHLISGFAQIHRIGDDTSGLEWERTRKMGINTLAFRMPQHNVFFCNDADCVGIREEIPWKLNSQWLQLLANSSTALFISLKREVMTKEIKTALKNAFKVASQVQQIAIPLDWMNTTCPKLWQTASRKMEFKWDIL